MQSLSKPQQTCDGRTVDIYLQGHEASSGLPDLLMYDALPFDEDDILDELTVNAVGEVFYIALSPDRQADGIRMSVINTAFDSGVTDTSITDIANVAISDDKTYATVTITAMPTDEQYHFEAQMVDTDGNLRGNWGRSVSPHKHNNGPPRIGEALRPKENSMRKLFALLLALCLLTGCVAPVEEPPAQEKPGVVIALLDTGISTAAIDSAHILPGYNYVLSSEDTEDRINHGTAAASVIVGCENAEVVGLATEAFLVPLVVTDKVDGKAKSVTPETLAQAIRDAVDIYGADIINVSLGIKKDRSELCDAVAYAESMGVLVVSAVGNDGVDGDPYYPAAYDSVLGVGSHDKNDEVSDFTQQNGTADLLAPGENIWLASRNGKTYGAKGSSYATAYVSATAALLLAQQPELTAEDVRQALISSARTVDGWLILDSEAALVSDSSTT